MLLYLYDESGAPIGLMFRMDEYSKNEYDYYFFEKNAFGDIIAVYNANGTKIGTYTYDAWGNICSTTCTASANTVDWMVVNQFNPFRYRGYFYDVETGLYYLQSRYYNPELGRFISVDGFISTGTGLLGYNMYIYCNNNPIMYVDPNGAWPKWVGVVTDFIVSGVAKVAGKIAEKGTYSFLRSCGFSRQISAMFAAAAKTAVTGAINNTVNAIYYEFCNPEDTVDEDSYHDRYLTRWERLRDAKYETEQEHYNVTAWMYYSEYSLHMWGWRATWWAVDKEVPIASWVARHTNVADMDPTEIDTRPVVFLPTIIIGILGW